MNYSENLPIESLDTYFSQIWLKIDSNKEMFLPSEKRWTSLYRCEAIKNEKISEFNIDIDKIEFSLKKEFDSLFVNKLDKIKHALIFDFHKETINYENEIALTIEKSLEIELTNLIQCLCNQEIKKACKKAQDEYIKRVDILSKKKKFDNVSIDLADILQLIIGETEQTINRCSPGVIDKSPLFQTIQVYYQIFF